MTLTRDDLEQVQRVAIYTNRKYYENILEIFITLVAGAVVGLVVSTTSPAPQNTATNSTTSPEQSQNIPAGEWVKPLDKMVMTSGFGGRMHPTLRYWKQHNGTDFLALIGTPAHAVFNGKISAIVADSACGNGIKLNSGEYQAVYCHLDSVLVKEGQVVKAGETIARTGNTGGSSGPHLHFGLKLNGQWIDPLSELKKRGLI